MIVSSLVCHAHAPMAIDCLGSLARLCSVELQFQIHDDGTLTEEDVELLNEKLPVARFVPRREADEQMAEALRGFKAARLLRERLPLALKLLDTVLLHSGEIYGFCDSDVLFLNRFGLPFQLPAGVNALFMEDREQCYSLRSWQKLVASGWRLPSRVNTGIVCLKKSCFDLEFVNWFLHKTRDAAIPFLAEQTAWGALGDRVGCRKLDCRQVRVMRNDESTVDLVAGHFTARSRHLLPAFLKQSKEADLLGDPIELQTVAPGSCTAWDIAKFEFRRLGARLIWKPASA